MDVNPFRYSGPLDPREMIDRDRETADLLALAEGRHSFRLVGPRRYGKTTLLRRVLAEAADRRMATVLVDMQDVLTTGEIVVRIERAYSRSLRGPLRRRVDSILKSWNIGLSLGAAGFTATLQRNPRQDAETVLLRLLELPAELHRRDGTRSLIVFDEIQDVLAVPGADGTLRSVIQHQLDAASYGFAGSATTVMEQLFADPARPLLDQAVPRDLAPLPLAEVADDLGRRFSGTGRDGGAGLDALVEFARGHPQRSMLLAHLLWERVAPGESADESTWVAAQDAALRDAHRLLYATWRAMPLNERRVALALAAEPGPLYGETTAAAVGVKRSVVRGAVIRLLGRGDALEDHDGRPRLTDPLLELWLQRRGLTTDAGDALDDEDA